MADWNSPQPPLTDWDDAYSNGAYIENAAAYPERWTQEARAFRDELIAAGRAELDVAYGALPRQQLDLFLPEGQPAGLAVFIHGGYWLAFDKSTWSHLARGAVARGFAVAMPSYTLAPEATVAAITGEIVQAVTLAAGRIAGDLRLAGHSAGGHLAARLLCKDVPLPAQVRARISHGLTISGLHDLRPLLRTAMGSKLFRSADEAAAESPALREPAGGVALTCWVGERERPEFLRQSALLANVWRGLGAATASVREPGRHHFDVIASLADADSPLTRAFVP